MGGDDGGGGSGLCSIGDTKGCTLQVCETASDCTGSGVATKTFSCFQPNTANYDSSSNTTTWSIGYCGASRPDWIVEFTGEPAVASYTASSAGGNQIGVTCYTESGTPQSQWVAGLDSVTNDQDLVGSYTLTFTSVAAQAGSPGTYDVHGTFHAECVPDAQITPNGAKGTIVVDGAF